MKKVRKNVFETNSSSTHSISIDSSEGLLDTLPLNEFGNVVIEGGEFGWEVENYRDAQSKASYAAIYVRDWSNNRKEEFRKILETVIKDQTGCNSIEFDFDRDRYDFNNYSYIDHQSVEDNDLDYLFEEPELLKQFIFNRKSVLHTDNDNY